MGRAGAQAQTLLSQLKSVPEPSKTQLSNKLRGTRRQFSCVHRRPRSRMAANQIWGNL